VTNVEQGILKHFEELVSERVALSSVILFGSGARGDAEPDSDLDVLVVTEGHADEPTREWISECAWEAGFDSWIVVVPIVYSRSEWERSPERYSLLAQAVERDGVPV